MNRIFKEGLLRYFGMSGSFKVRLAKTRGELVLHGQLLAAMQELSRKRYPQDQYNLRFMELTFLDEGRIAR
ncbi:hypothetical protein LP420_12400 [Massilia sp. B-10]|nr:hypothetical protein LP420_12400 [Massilia sp. B-10]